MKWVSLIFAAILMLLGPHGTHAAPTPTRTPAISQRFPSKTSDLIWYTARLKAFALNDQVWLARAYEGLARGASGRVTSIDAEWELIVVTFDDGQVAKFDMVVQASKLLLSVAPK